MKPIYSFSLIISLMIAFFASGSGENILKIRESSFKPLTVSSNDAVLANIQGAELAIMTKLQGNLKFKEYYLFQYNRKSILFDLAKINSAKVIEATEDHVKLNIDGAIVVFTINSKYSNPDEIVYYGYGLSRRTGNFKIGDDDRGNDINHLMEIISVNGKTVKIDKKKCPSGGPGSSECSVNSGTPENVTSCSVKCNSGYYTCCDQSVNECTCENQVSYHEGKTKAVISAYPTS